jgi:hypothetical protein
MQRIAQIALVCGLAAALAGCRSSSRIDIGPVPEPTLGTDHVKRSRRPYKPPVYARTVPKPVPPAPRPTWRVPAEWTPPGGIRRSRWQCIVVHHTASPKDSPESIHNYHLRQKGWPNGMGYHFVIGGTGPGYPDGAVYVGNRWKRQITGAHCKTRSGRYFGTWRRANYFNSNGIGICLIGNFENSRPSRKQLQSLERLVGFLCDRTAADPSRVYGHGEVTHRTACPGKNLSVASLRHSTRGIHATSR